MTMETPHSAQRHTHHGTQDSSVAGPDEVALKTAPWQVMWIDSLDLIGFKIPIFWL